jgi:uncharacterized protein YbjQ (UPF0145 family)
MSPKVQDYLERAEHCERMASAAKDSGAKAAFVEVAQQWRDLARQQERLEKQFTRPQSK